MLVRSLGQEDPLEEGMATHSSTLAWRIPWSEEPGSLPSMGSHERWSSLKQFSMNASYSLDHCYTCINVIELCP